MTAAGTSAPEDPSASSGNSSGSAVEPAASSVQGRRGATTVGIVGLGLIGGSIALDLVAAGHPVVALEPDRPSGRAAMRVGIDVVDDVAAIAAVADIVVVATPPSTVADIVMRVAAGTDAPVTDVASVRDPQALGIAAPWPSSWVGSHPMAGTERTSFAAARRGLLVGAPWLLTPHDDVDMGALAAVVELALTLQTRPMVVAATTHDAMVATVSHLPHLLAYGLQQRGREVGGDVVAALAGPSFRDATRVAASSPEFWADLVVRNRDALATTLREMQSWLDDTIAMAAQDPVALVARLDGARRRPGPRTRSGEGDEVVSLADPSQALATLRAAGACGRHVTTIATVGATPTLSLAPPTS